MASQSSSQPSPAAVSPNDADSSPEDAEPTAATNAAQSGLEETLTDLLQTLLELGICATDVDQNALDSDGMNGTLNPPGGLIGTKVVQVISQLAALNDIKNEIDPDISIPMEVINHVDQGNNPDRFNREFIERVAGENMYANGIVQNVQDYQSMLGSELGAHFPELKSSIDEIISSKRPASNEEDVAGDVDMKMKMGE